MLEEILFDNSIKDWGISLLIVITAAVACKIVVLFNRHVLKKLAAKSKSHLDDILFSTLEKPAVMGIMLAAIWVASMRLIKTDSAHKIIEDAYRILTVINVTWFISKFVSALIDEYGEKNFNNRLLPLLKRGVLILIWAIGIVTALHNVGIQVATLLGGLGIGGVAVALAAQDSIKNIFGGITIFTDRPFSIGDLIQFDSYEGTVQDIGLRSTRILTYEKRMVTVPNYKLTDASVVNISAEPQRRVLIKLGLTYDTTPQKMQEAIELLKNLPQAVEEIDNETIVSFSEFGESALIITYIYYIKKPINAYETNSKVNFEILNRFNNAGLNFAFPTQTIYLNS
ncbi:MAG: mechanosensitive ion channel family protein [Prevotellaceae bacterium]|jgi:MscS family membrane protein|nr:mechanosensitive ion channel family protein [Prevotellaceae bacterium]